MQQTLRARCGIAKGLNDSQKPAKFDSNLPAHSCNDRKQNASTVLCFFSPSPSSPSLSLSLFLFQPFSFSLFQSRTRSQRSADRTPVAYRYAPFQINSHCLLHEFFMRIRRGWHRFFLNHLTLTIPWKNVKLFPRNAKAERGYAYIHIHVNASGE